MSSENEELPVIRISVRNLVEFILRKGDIDDRISRGLDRDAMLMGSRIHRKIQRRMGSDYHAEVPLKKEVVFDGFHILVEGRADGIITEQDKAEPGITIDEIKGVLRELRFIEKPEPLHLAQAKCYAAIYADREEICYHRDCFADCPDLFAKICPQEEGLSSMISVYDLAGMEVYLWMDAPGSHAACGVKDREG